MHASLCRASGQSETFGFQFDLADVGVCRAGVTDFLCRHNAVDDVLDDVQLVVSELVSNAIKHGPDKSGTVTIVAEQDRFVLEVSGTDRIPDPATRALPAPTEPTGRGLILVAAVTDEVGFVDTDGERFIRCTRHR